MKPAVIFCLILTASLLAAPPEASPSGLWKTIDDKTRQPRGLVRIYEQDGALFGRIEGSFNPAEARDVCDKCSGEQRNHPVIGLVILRGLKKRGAEYSGGEILDPDGGSIYRCRLTLEDNDAKLVVRGYIGLPLAGRSQIWYRRNFWSQHSPWRV